MTLEDLREFCQLAVGVAALGIIILFVPSVAITAIDYHFNAGPTVDAINAQCNTKYTKRDYLVIGKDEMIKLCDIRERRVELKWRTTTAAKLPRNLTPFSP